MPSNKLKFAENAFYQNDLVPFVAARVAPFKRIIRYVEGEKYHVFNLGMGEGSPLPNIKAHKWLKNGRGYGTLFSIPEEPGKRSLALPSDILRVQYPNGPVLSFVRTTLRTVNLFELFITEDLNETDRRSLEEQIYRSLIKPKP